MSTVANVFAALVLAAPTAAPATAAADLNTAAVTSDTMIEVITVNGSGCPGGTSAVMVSETSGEILVTFSAYTARVGVGAKPVDFRQNCQINLVVHLPSGFTYAPAQAEYRGFMSLAAGATAVQRTSYYFQGMSPTAAESRVFAGPVEGDWTTVWSVGDPITRLFAPCGETRNLNINTELRVLAGTSDVRTTASFASMDNFTGLRFVLKRCQ